MKLGLFMIFSTIVKLVDLNLILHMLILYPQDVIHIIHLKMKMNIMLTVVRQKMIRDIPL